MSIFVRPCGHSDDKTSIHHIKNPDECYYCDYLVKHPRPGKVVRNPTGLSGQRKADSNHAKAGFKGSKAKDDQGLAKGVNA